jgi:2,4-dienoyl-CoA reductase-like NADH-dependent reductase (Old Yellow Enzyme family)
MPHLFDPLPLRSITARNRIAVSPMCQYSSVEGFANDWHLVHLGSRAVGGAGIVFTEATAVAPEGRISPCDLGLWDDAHITMLQRITSFIEAQGAVPGIQLGHAGRKASVARPWEGGEQLPLNQGGWETIGPSTLPFRAGQRAPRAATEEDLTRLVEDFQAAAKRALTAGFKIVEIHAAHGYLLHAFLSPVANQREDAYGGSLENRSRLLLRVVAAVREVWPSELPLFVRISADDWLPGREAWTIDQSVALVHMLQPMAVDLIDVSSGGTDPAQQIEVGAGYQVPFAARIRQETGMATGAVGMISTAAQAETIVRSGQADLVLMARELLRDPHFPLHAAADLHAHEVKWPHQYERAKRR